MSETEPVDAGQSEPSGNPTRKYIILAVVLVVVIVVAAIVLVIVGIPALTGGREPTAVAESTATPVPTFTPGATKAPTSTPQPLPSPSPSGLVMEDTDAPLFEFDSAGARPSVEWTGFFGQVLDTAGGPVANVSVVVWYRDGTPASAVVQTDETGYYEIRLANAPLAGIWSVQVLTDEWRPASKLNTFETDENTETGIQQIQVVWKQVP